MKNRIVGSFGPLVVVASAGLALVIVFAGPNQEERTARDLKLVFGVEQRQTPTEVAVAGQIVDHKLAMLEVAETQMAVPLTAPIDKQMIANAASWQRVNAQIIAMDAGLTADQRDWASIEAALTSVLATSQKVTSNLPKRETAGDILKRYGEKTKT